MTERLLIGGDQVIPTLRGENAIADMQAQHGDRLAVCMLDFTDTAAVRELVDDAFDRTGRNEVAVSTAGYGLFGAAEELTDAQIDHQIAANRTGSIQFVRGHTSPAPAGRRTDRAAFDSKGGWGWHLTRSVESPSRVKNLMQAHIVAIAAPQATEDNRRYQG